MINGSSGKHMDDRENFFVKYLVIVKHFCYNCCNRGDFFEQF